jgi:hypothetical protein
MSMLPVVNGHKVNGKVRGLICDEGKTKQKVGIEHDINKIVAKFKRTGEMPLLSFNNGVLSEEGKIIDMTNIGDYQECQNRMAAAREMFDRYPAIIRRRFNNSIEEFVTFMGNLTTQEKIDEAVNLGIIEKVKPVNMDDEKKGGEPK